MGWLGPGAQDLLSSHQGLRATVILDYPGEESSSKSVQLAGFSWSMAAGQRPLSVPDHADLSASHNVAAGLSE